MGCWPVVPVSTPPNCWSDFTQWYVGNGEESARECRNHCDRLRADRVWFRIHGHVQSSVRAWQAGLPADATRPHYFLGVPPLVCRCMNDSNTEGILRPT